KVALTFGIESGQYSAVPLDGVRFVFFAQSKAVMTHGGWIGGIIVDSSASDAQADAVTAIASGAAGGPLGLFATMLADFRGVERHPIVFVKEGRSVSVKIDGRLDQTVTATASAAVPAECLAIDNPVHPANKRLNRATGLRNVISAFGIEWTGQPDRTNGHFAPFDWQGEAAGMTTPPPSPPRRSGTPPSPPPRGAVPLGGPPGNPCGGGCRPPMLALFCGGA